MRPAPSIVGAHCDCTVGKCLWMTQLGNEREGKDNGGGANLIGVYRATGQDGKGN